MPYRIIVENNPLNWVDPFGFDRCYYEYIGDPFERFTGKVREQFKKWTERFFLWNLRSTVIGIF